MVQIIKSLDYEIEKKECNELRLRSGCIITSRQNRDYPSTEIETPPIDIPPLVINIELNQGEETD